MQLLVLVSVLTSVFGTGLGLTLGQILDPLRDLRVALAPLANLVLIPASAAGIAALLDLGEAPDRRSIIQLAGKRWRLKPGGEGVGVQRSSRLVMIGLPASLDAGWLE